MRTTSSCRLLLFTLSLVVLPLQAQQTEATESVVAVEQAQPAEQQQQTTETEQADKPVSAALPANVRGTNDTTRPTAGLGLGKMAISLAIVVAIVLLLGWTFKKLTLRLPGSKHIKVISSMPLGPKERLLVVEIQGKQRVIGVTPHSINLLFELENSLPEEKLASDFHTQLQSFLKK